MKQELSENELEKLESNLIILFGFPIKSLNELGEEIFEKKYFWNEPKLGMHLNIRSNVNYKTYVEKHQGTTFPRYDYFFFNAYKSLWQKYLRILILNRIFAQFNSLDNKIIMKEFEGIFGSSMIMRSLPKSKLLIFASSIENLIIMELEKSKINYKKVKMKKKEELILRKARICLEWAKILTDTFELHSQNLRKIITIQDVKLNSKKELDKIQKFCGISNKLEFEQNKIEEFDDDKIINITQILETKLTYEEKIILDKFNKLIEKRC